MKLAAERYSPEMAEAFQPTETERPATKKSPAVFEVRAERKPITTVTTTVTSENARIQGSYETAARNLIDSIRFSERLWARLDSGRRFRRARLQLPRVRWSV